MLSVCGFLCSLFGLEIAGERNICELGGVQCRGLCRDGLPLGALRLFGCSWSLNRCSLKTHPKRDRSSVCHMNPFMNRWAPINPSSLPISAGIPPSSRFAVWLFTLKAESPTIFHISVYFQVLGSSTAYVKQVVKTSSLQSCVNPDKCPQAMSLESASVGDYKFEIKTNLLVWS